MKRDKQHGEDTDELEDGEGGTDTKIRKRPYTNIVFPTYQRTSRA